MKRLLIVLAFVLFAPAALADNVTVPGASGVPTTAGQANTLAPTYFPAVDANDLLVYQFNDMAASSGATSATTTFANSTSLTAPMVALTSGGAGQATQDTVPWPGGRAVYVPSTNNSLTAICGYASGGSTPAGCPTINSQVPSNGTTGYTSVSFSFWVFSQGQNSTTYPLVWFGGSNQISLVNGAVNANIQTTVGNGQVGCTSTGTVSPWQWHHIGVAFTALAAPQIYIDGALASSCAAIGGGSALLLYQVGSPNGVIPNWGYMGFGNYTGGTTGNMYIADFRYSNVARSANYFKQMYSGYLYLTGGYSNAFNNYFTWQSPLTQIGVATTSVGAGTKIASSRVTQANKPTTPVDFTGGATATVSQILDASIFTCGTSATLTLPTAQGATGLVQALPNAAVGDLFSFVVAPGGAQTCTLAVGAGWTIYASATTNTVTRTVWCRVTGVTANAETVTCY